MTAPGNLPGTETLRNGLVVTIRPLRADDRERLVRAFRLLDKESIYRRFFMHRKEFTEAELDRAVITDPDREVALVATINTSGNETIVGSGRYIVVDTGGAQRSAEVAFAVEEDYHNLGIASRLLRHLIDAARARGIAGFEADVLADNQPMLAVFARCGLPMRQQRDEGVVHVTLLLQSPSD